MASSIDPFACGWACYGCRRTFRGALRRLLHELFACEYME